MHTTYIVVVGSRVDSRRTIARELTSSLLPFGMTIQDSFMAPVKHFIATALGEKYNSLKKSGSRPELFGFSIVEFLFDTRHHFRTIYGSDVFGKWLVHRSLRNPIQKPMFVVIDDGGIPDDILSLPNRIIVCAGEPNLFAKGPPADYVIVSSQGDKVWAEIKTVVADIMSKRSVTEPSQGSNE